MAIKSTWDSYEAIQYLPWYYFKVEKIHQTGDVPQRKKEILAREY